MSGTVVDALVLDLLEWLELRDRTYEETLDAWRTSCPRLTVWEDATDRGLVAIEARHGRSWVQATPAGRQCLQQFRPRRTAT